MQGMYIPWSKGTWPESKYACNSTVFVHCKAFGIVLERHMHVSILSNFVVLVLVLGIIMIYVV